MPFPLLNTHVSVLSRAVRILKFLFNAGQQREHIPGLWLYILLIICIFRTHTMLHTKQSNTIR